MILCAAVSHVCLWRIDVSEYRPSLQQYSYLKHFRSQQAVWCLYWTSGDYCCTMRQRMYCLSVNACIIWVWTGIDGNCNTTNSSFSSLALVSCSWQNKVVPLHWSPNEKQPNTASLKKNYLTVAGYANLDLFHIVETV